MGPIFLTRYQLQGLEYKGELELLECHVRNHALCSTGLGQVGPFSFACVLNLDTNEVLSTK